MAYARVLTVLHIYATGAEFPESLAAVLEWNNIVRVAMADPHGRLYVSGETVDVDGLNIRSLAVLGELF